MTLDRKKILKRISELMEEKGISQYKLKENTDVSTTITQWRKNPSREVNRIPSLHSIVKICEFFDISLSYFFAFDSHEKRSARIMEISSNMEPLNNEQLDIIDRTVNEFKKTLKE